MFFFNSAESNSITKLAAFYDRISKISTLKICIAVEVLKAIKIDEAEEVKEEEERE